MFPKRFAYFVDLTKSTISEIAKVISFDRSYVSKWYNGKSLPSEESWRDILPTLSIFFADKMTEEEIKDFSFISSSIQSAIHNAELNRVIASYLDDGFTFSNNEKKKEEDSMVENMALILDGVEEILPYIIDSINKAIGITKPYDTSTMYYTDDILFALGENEVDQLYFLYTGNEYHEVRFTVDVENIDPESMEAIYRAHIFFRLSSQLPFLEFQIYDKIISQDYSIFAIKDVAASYNTSALKLDEFYSFAMHNRNIINKVFEEVDDEFSKLSPLVEAESDFAVLSEQMNNSTSKNQPILYIPSFPAYFASNELREEMYDKKILTDIDYNTWPLFTDFIRSKGFAKAKFIIPEEVLNKTFDEGILKICSGYVKVDDDIISKYKNDVYYKLIEKSKAGDLVIIDKDIPNQHRLPRCVIYSDGIESFYLRPNQQDPYSTGKFYFPFKSNNISRTIYKYLDCMLDVDECPIFR